MIILYLIKTTKPFAETAKGFVSNKSKLVEFTNYTTHYS